MKSAAATDMLSRQMQIVHFTRFHLRGKGAEFVLEARRAWASECEACDGFCGGLLVSFDEGDWLDISIWEPTRTQDLGRLAGAPPIEFVDRIGEPCTEVLGQESGVLALGGDAR